MEIVYLYVPNRDVWFETKSKNGAESLELRLSPKFMDTPDTEAAFKSSAEGLTAFRNWDTL